MSSSFSFRSFDDDDTDDSLLLSPAVDRVRSDSDAADRRVTTVTTIAINSITEAPTDESFMIAKTPKKSKFNYASALEELEFLAPTPATAKIERTRIQANCEEDEGSLLDRPLSRQLSPPALASSPVKGKTTALPSNELIKSRVAASSLPKHPNLTQIADLSPSMAPSFESVDDAATTSYPDCNETSVFRQPCIRRLNSNESLSMELNLGRPVNESNDIAEFNLPSGIGYGEHSDEHLVKDADLSMEVEKQLANANYDALELEECNRFDSANMKAYLAIASEVERTGTNENEDDVTKSLLVSRDLEGDAVVHPTSTARPAIAKGPWDVMDSEESEEDTVTNNQQFRYVERMNESIASYFSSHGGTNPPEHEVNPTNDSLEFSSDLNGSLEESNVGLLLVRPSVDKEQLRSHDCEEDVMLHNPGETEYSSEFDDTEHALSAMGDDAAKIDVDQGTENTLTDVKECKEYRVGSQGSLVGVTSSHQDDSECEPSIDFPNSKPSAGEFQLRTGARGHGKSDSLSAEDIADIDAPCSGISDRSAPKLTTESNSDAGDRTKMTSACIGAAKNSGGDINDCRISGITSAITDDNDPILVVDARDDAAQPVFGGGTRYSLLPIDSEVQAEQEFLSDAQHDFDFDYSVSVVEDDINASAVQVPPKNNGHQELSLSNASIGSFSDVLSPIWGSAPSHNSILDNTSPDLRIEIATENLSNDSGEVKPSIDGVSNDEYRMAIETSCGGSARNTAQSDTVVVKASPVQIHFQQKSQEYSASDQVDSQDHSFRTRNFDLSEESAEETDNVNRIQTSNESNDGTASENPSAVLSLENKRASLEDLSSYQQSFNSTSNAFLERLREGAELRKREVTRGRHSMERKEQILSEEKNVRVQKMSTVSEERSKSPSLHSISKASRLRKPSIDYSSIRSADASGRRSLGREDDDPYRPFKATPLPATSFSNISTVSLGAKRKSSTVFRPIPTQSNINVKSLALNIKPPKRLLSGEDASNAKEMSLKKRIQEEETKIRRESTFKALPLPVTTRARSFEPLVGENLVHGKSVQSGKENIAFVPRSSLRAEERKLFDIAKAEREELRRQDEIEHRKLVIDELNSEINELKKFLR